MTFFSITTQKHSTGNTDQLRKCYISQVTKKLLTDVSGLCSGNRQMEVKIRASQPRS